MRTHRLATLAAASTIALLALGGTAFALGTDDTAPPAAVSTTTAAATPTTTSASSVGSARASAIAVNHVGGGTVTKVERELEHGRVEWKVDVLSGGIRHEVRVDDATGTVTRAGSAATSRSAAPRSPAPRSATPRSAAPAPAVRGDDGPLHDVGDDHGGASVKGSDDGAAHDAADDHGRHGGGDDD